MIVDQIENYKQYPFGTAWNRAMEFLMALKPDKEEKKHTVQGEDIFALVMSYETHAPETGLFEAHRKYIDIQAVLAGAEIMEYAPIDGLVINKSFDPSNDVELFERPQEGLTHVALSPGLFAALFPQDAHMPMLVLGNAPARVKKAVIKLKVELLEL